MHRHLFIPDFFSTEGEDSGDRLVAAETLFAKGRRRRLAPSSPEAWLFERFAVPKQRDWPVAPYTLLADGGAPERDFWLRADPVHLRLGRDTLTFADTAAFDVSRTESEALVETLNRHFGDAMLFYPVQPARWYVRLRETPDMHTTPPSAAREGLIEGNLPFGPDAMRFHALMNEAQMLLHEHPVNAEREARGEPALNSVWFWGGGVMVAAKEHPFSIVFGDDPLARGLALAAGIPARALPEDAGAMLAAAGGEGTALVVMDSSRSAAGHSRERRAALERDWFGPLLAALQSGRIGMLSLSLPGTDSLLEVETVRPDLRHFWRLKRPLADYLGSRA